eukprot:TRINITY_DN568_c0_g1_i1.p1 TRINITY_DN568_c0_g1~~TRINITY_DN568_c0_g1_i1.p1  ORF type:complete len:430 (+),score=21.08 TRINITY_DN568_c0_g1_i1:386-1675(+)
MISRRFSTLVNLKEYTRKIPLKAPMLVEGKTVSPVEVASVARACQPVKLGSPVQAMRSQERFEFTLNERKRLLYGVHTNYGGQAVKGNYITSNEAIDRQTNLILGHCTDAGNALPKEFIRAAMLLRANSLIQGASGVSFSLLERCEVALNKGLTPVVKEHGSIGASGDLLPLARICGALSGITSSCKIEGPDGEILPAPEALARHNLPKISLRPKDGIGFINGTSFSLGIGCLALYDAVRYFDFSLSIAALACNAMLANMEAFHEYVARIRPHPSHGYVASILRERLEGSKLVVKTINEAVKSPFKTLVQDRYPVRCLPQYMSPLLDKLSAVEGYFASESRTISDNPVLDSATGEVYHGGNFLASSPAMGCDDIRYCLGIMVKCVDVLLGHLHEPSMMLFSAIQCKQKKSIYYIKMPCYQPCPSDCPAH